MEGVFFAFLSRFDCEDSMSFKPMTLLLGLTLVLSCGPNREVAAESLEANCHAQPTSASRSEGRWMYHTIRGTGQKCWLLRVDGKSIQRVEQNAVVLEHEPQSRLAEQAVPSCVTSSNAPAPRDTQWRYRTNRKTGQKCWHLSRLVLKQMPVARARTGPSGQPSHFDKDQLNRLGSVAGAQASLLAPSSPRGTVSAGHDEMNANPANQATITTFESRWVAPTEAIRLVNAETSQLGQSELIPNDDEKPVPNVMKSQTGHYRVVDSEQMAGLLGATLVSVGIALGLYTLISDSAASLRGARDRASASRFRKDAPAVRSSPPIDSTIADILERLNSEDARALADAKSSGAREAGADSP
jgi:hypothetical protein